MPDQMENVDDPIDASQLDSSSRPPAGGQDRPGAEGTAAGANNLTVPDPSGEEIANSIPADT